MGKLRRVVLTKFFVNPETKQKEPYEEEFIICDVCGHANPILNHECEQCSNFLEDIPDK